MKKIIIASVITLFFGCAFDTVDISTIDLSQYTNEYQDGNQIIIPDSPVNISVDSGNGQITISWDSCPGSDSYNLYYSTVQGNHNTKMANVTSPLTLSSLVNGTVYYFGLTSQNSAGESAESLEKKAMPGVIDNMNGTISDLTSGLIWSKCSQAGVNLYNSFMNDCSNGFPSQYQICNNDWKCDNLIVINEASMAANGTFSEAYNACASRGPGWRLPTMSELENFSVIYRANPNLWPDVGNYYVGRTNYYYWSGSAYMDIPQYGYSQVGYDISAGAPAQNTMPISGNRYHVICVN